MSMWKQLRTEAVLSLAGLFGETFYLDGKSVRFDASLGAARNLSPAEKVAVKDYLCPLASSHWTVRKWVDCEEKRGRYLDALAGAVEQLVLDPYMEKLLGLESRGDELTFTELRVQLAPDTLLLANIAKMVETIEDEGLWGPDLLSHLQACSQTGVPHLRILYSELFQRTAHVFHYQVSLWMRQGVLSDPDFEFFIQEASAQGDVKQQQQQRHGWDRFEVVPSLVPRFLSDSTVDKVLFVGKCAQLLGSLDEGDSLVDLANLDESVNVLSRRVKRDLWQRLIDEYNLLAMFERFRSLFLLGMGRVFQVFASHSVWSKSPTKNANGELKRAWKECFSGSESVAWDGNYANGWDGVCISISVEWPMSLVFNSEVVGIYQSVFQVLFKLLRAEAAVTKAWWECRNHPSHQIRDTHRSMLAVVLDFRRHVMMNVVEQGFRVLIRSLSENEAGGEQAKDFSFVLECHKAFLSRLEKGLYLTGKTRALRRATDELLESILAFCALFDNEGPVGGPLLQDPEVLGEALRDFGRQLSLFEDLVLQKKKKA